MTNCKLMEICVPSECPADIDCPYDLIAETGKDRSTSRKRHHNAVKAKENSFISAEILSAKADRISNSKSNNEKYARYKRMIEAEKKCEKFQKQIQEREKNLSPYKK